MDARSLTIRDRIEDTLTNAVARLAAHDAPPRFGKALHYAVFPGGARIRPRLCLAVAHACGDSRPDLSNAAAAAIEMLHCASLVHDDMPCFDNADIRRGKPSVHRQHGEPLALLVGDALIIAAFETIARAAADRPDRLAGLTVALAAAAGSPHGLVAGQAWESESTIPLDLYHRAKTASLFIGATSCGAIAAGADPSIWRTLGEKLGAAYQTADDLRDAAGDEADLGKPIGQDQAHARPNAVIELGIEGTLMRLQGLVQQAIAAIPDCPGAHDLEALIRGEAKRLVPKKMAQFAA